MYTHTHTRMHTHTHTRTHAHTHTHTRTHAHTHTHTHLFGFLAAVQIVAGPLLLLLPPLLHPLPRPLVQIHLNPQALLLGSWPLLSQWLYHHLNADIDSGSGYSTELHKVLKPR